MFRLFQFKLYAICMNLKAALKIVLVYRMKMHLKFSAMIIIIHCLCQDLEKGGYQTLDGDLDLANVQLPLPEDEEGILEYKFPKFAATHFQGNATHTFIRRPLRQSLLVLKNEGDELVSQIKLN